MKLIKRMQFSHVGAFCYLEAQRHDCLKLSVSDAFIIGDCSLGELSIWDISRASVGSPDPGLTPAYSFHTTSELHV